MTGRLKFPGLKNLYPEARREAGLPEDLKLKTIRKDFANRMRGAGASKDLIKFHQGRERGDVTNHDYLDDGQGLELTTDIVSKMFGEKQNIVSLVR